MNKRWIFVVLGAGGLAATGAVLWWQQVDDVRSRTSVEGAAKAAPPQLGRKVRSAQGEAAPDVDALLADSSPRAWGKVVGLYPTASDETKRQVLRKATTRKHLKQALNQVLQTVGEDPTPIAEDPMVGETAQMLKERWQSPEDLELGRHMMLLQDTDKKRWVLGKALVAAARDVGATSPLFAQKNRLKAKLVDLHSQVSSDHVRAEIVDSLHELGGRDAALILAQGPDIGDNELEGVSEKQRAVGEVLGEAE